MKAIVKLNLELVLEEHLAKAERAYFEATEYGGDDDILYWRGYEAAIQQIKHDIKLAVTYTLTEAV